MNDDSSLARREAFEPKLTALLLDELSPEETLAVR
jgi:hypothetical protein